MKAKYLATQSEFFSGQGLFRTTLCEKYIKLIASSDADFQVQNRFAQNKGSKK